MRRLDAPAKIVYSLLLKKMRCYSLIRQDVFQERRQGQPGVEKLNYCDDCVLVQA